MSELQSRWLHHEIAEILEEIGSKYPALPPIRLQWSNLRRVISSPMRKAGVDRLRLQCSGLHGSLPAHPDNLPAGNTKSINDAASSNAPAMSQSSPPQLSP